MSVDVHTKTGTILDWILPRIQSTPRKQNWVPLESGSADSCSSRAKPPSVLVKSYGLACGLDNYSTVAVICARSIVCAHWTLYSILQVTELPSGLHSRVSSVPYCFKVDLAISTIYTLNLTVVCTELRLGTR